MELLSGIATNRLAINYKYKLDFNQIENLVNLAFSSKPDAKAKFNLLARVNGKVFGEILNESKKVLEIAITEASLTQTEVLYLVFPAQDKSGDRRCAACETAQNLDGAVYHAECPVVKWLTEKCRFRYDREDGCLYPKEHLWLAPGKRRLLVEILSYHAKLRVDVVKRIANETVYYKRTDSGDLIPKQLRSQRDDQIVGTYAWLRAHGLVK